MLTSITRARSNNGFEILNQWTALSKSGRHVFLSLTKNNFLIIQVFEPSNGLSEDEWKTFDVIPFFYHENKIITNCELHLCLIENGLLEIPKWKSVVYRAIFPILNLFQSKKLNRQLLDFDFM